MRYLILTDIHGNLQALEAVLDAAQSVGYDQILVLGDLVGYGADPGAVLDRVMALAPVAIIRGNHDKVCAGLEPATMFNDAARASAEWTHTALSPAQLRVLTGLAQGPMRVTDVLEICHGAPFDEDYYIFDATDAGRALGATSARICLFGHTHLPALFATADDPVEPSGEPGNDTIRLPRSGPVLINVGAVGQPRDGDPRAAYGLIDLEANTLQLRRVTYDVAGAQRRIREAGLPAWLADRLAVGQ